MDILNGLCGHRFDSLEYSYYLHPNNNWMFTLNNSKLENFDSVLQQIITHVNASYNGFFIRERGDCFLLFVDEFV